MADAAVIERYVGLPYVPGRFDCADLVMQVAREVYGSSVTLPQDRPRPTRVMSMARTIGRLQASVAAPRAAGEPPQDGDGVLLSRGLARPTHIGIVAYLAGEPWVLHNDDCWGSSILTRVRDLRAAGWTLHGVYTWIS
jgi:hypothetical protein